MSPLHPSVAASRVAVRRSLADGAVRATSPTGGERADVLVACSGGPDSLALAAALAFEAPRAGLRAGAVVVDHGLQDGSERVAARAAEQCEGLGLHPVLVRRIRVDEASGAGIEAAARQARYEALRKAADETGAHLVLLGHTMDDQAETVLMRLTRGSGARSLAGIPPKRGIFGRPFLGLRRTQTIAACVDQGLKAWQDPTNSSLHPDSALRARVRDDVLATVTHYLGPGVIPALARTADALREDNEALDSWAERAFELADGGKKGLKIEELRSLPAAVRTRVLRRYALAEGARGDALTRTHIRGLDALVTDWHGQGPVALPGGIWVAHKCGRLKTCLSSNLGTE